MDWSERDKSFFNTVYDQTHHILIRISYNITFNMEVAEELCHDALIKFYERLNHMHDPTESKYWLIRVVKNMSLNYAKHKTREFRAYARVLKEPVQNPDSGEDIVLKQESALAVQFALNVLPPNLKEVLVLIEYAQLSHREIGKILRISEANVKIRAFRARKKMALFLERKDVYIPE